MEIPNFVPAPKSSPLADLFGAKRAEFEKAALSIEGGAYEWDDSPDGVQEFKRTVTASVLSSW